MIGCPSGTFCNHCAGNRSILVADIFSDIESVALLASAYKLALALIVADDVGYVLEACEDIIDLHSVFFANCTNELCGDDGLHTVAPRSERTLFVATTEDVICEDRAGLVTIEQHHLALVVTHSDSHAVRVRVGRQHEVGIFPVSHRNCHRERLTVLRIRRLDCREVAVTDVLFRNVENVLESHAVQKLRNDAYA